MGGRFSGWNAQCFGVDRSRGRGADTDAAARSAQPPITSAAILIFWFIVRNTKFTECEPGIENPRQESTNVLRTHP